MMFYSDAVLVNATLNCLGILIRTRQSIANKILSAILNFNPLKQANSPMTPKLKVMIKSMERTTKVLLININKRFVFASAAAAFMANRFAGTPMGH